MGRGEHLVDFVFPSGWGGICLSGIRRKFVRQTHRGDPLSAKAGSLWGKDPILGCYQERAREGGAA